MVTALFKKDDSVTVRGLMQWDYGQELKILADIDIQDGTEVQFYQGMLSSVARTSQSIVRIPDKMLTNEMGITAYIYARNEASGETVLTVRLPVTARPRPEDYVLPEYTGYSRLLPEGGETGQVPVVQLDEEGNRSVVWADKADNAKIVDGALQLMSGDREIGDRIRLSGAGGREIELRRGQTAIQWRYTDSNEWTDLIPIADIKGDPGETPMLERRGDHLWAVYSE